MLSLGSTLDFLPSDYRSSHVGWVGGKILVVIRPLGVVVGGLVWCRFALARPVPPFFRVANFTRPNTTDDLTTLIIFYVLLWTWCWPNTTVAINIICNICGLGVGQILLMTSPLTYYFVRNM